MDGPKRGFVPPPTACGAFSVVAAFDGALLCALGVVFARMFGTTRGAFWRLPFPLARAVALGAGVSFTFASTKCVLDNTRPFRPVRSSALAGAFGGTLAGVALHTPQLGRVRSMLVCGAVFAALAAGTTAFVERRKA